MLYMAVVDATNKEVKSWVEGQDAAVKYVGERRGLSANARHPVYLSAKGAHSSGTSLTRPPLSPLADCGPNFLLPDGSVDFALMHDGVHPHGKGGRLRAQCMLGALEGSDSSGASEEEGQDEEFN